MKLFSKIVAVSAAVLGIATIVTLQAGAEENRVTFPENYAKYIRYGIFDCGSSGEEPEEQNLSL